MTTYQQLKPFERARVDFLTKAKLRFECVDVETGRKLPFDSFAIVRTSPREAKHSMKGVSTKTDKIGKTPSYIPLPILGLDRSDLRELFWLDVTELVINGKKIKGGLCGACRRYTSCVLAGLGKDKAFKCRVSRKDLRFLTSRRSRRSSSSQTG